MGKRGVEFRVGLFVAVALLILFLGFFWLGDYRAARRGYGFKVLFTDVGGLRPGDPVQIAGVEKGKVRQVELKEQAVEVSLWLDSDVELKQDCRVLIRDIAMISGTKFIKVDPGRSGIPLDISQPLWGVSPPDFSISDLQTVANHLTDLVDEEMVKSLKEAVENVSRLTLDLRRLASQSRADLIEGVKELRAASQKLNELISSEELHSALGALQAISRRLEEMSEGGGTLGKLVNDEQLYNELTETTRALRDLLEDIKAHPRKYVKFSIF